MGQYFRTYEGSAPLAISVNCGSGDYRMTGNDLMKKYGETRLALYGYSASGIALGDDSGYDTKIADEEFGGECDPLVHVDMSDNLALRSMYYHKGYTDDPGMCMRAPALAHLKEFAGELSQQLGWTTRAMDLYRPPSIHQAGVCWALDEKLKIAKIDATTFKQAVADACYGRTASFSLEEIARLCRQANTFFTGVAVKSVGINIPDGLDPVVVKVAANLEAIPAELDLLAISTHGSGGVADLDFFHGATGTPVNMGVPVDFPDAPMSCGYFEDEVPTMEVSNWQDAGLGTVEARKAYYRKLVNENDELRVYLASCGVDLDAVVNHEGYFEAAWEEIRTHRRALLAVAAQCGVFFYAGEIWHADFDDAIGGVRSRRLGIRSGGPSYAVYRGHDTCAWGNALPLYTALTGRSK